MPHRFTKVDVQPTSPKIKTSDKIICLGSCFASHMGDRLRAHYWDALVNPLGILYNTESIAKVMTMVQSGADTTRYGSRDDIYFHYDVHSTMSAMSYEQLQSNIENGLSTLSQYTDKASWVVLTLGTSIVYQLRNDEGTVANCHKASTDLFCKNMLTVEESYKALKSIVYSYPSKNYIITVSPVRHTREGAVENQRSKARLIEAAHQLTDICDQVHYFPAYEIMMDELRDYRYYTDDLIHPTTEAVDYIWETFINTYFTQDSKEKVKEISKYNKDVSHRPLFPESKSAKQFANYIMKKRQELEGKYPEMKQR